MEMIYGQFLCRIVGMNTKFVRVMVPYFFALVFVVFSYCSAKAAWIEITTCGPLKGFAYFFEDGVMVPKGKGGWKEDGISKGSFTLLNEGSNFDIVYTDAAGRTRSALSHDRATIIGSARNEFIVVHIFHEGGSNTEQYVFRLDRSGAGEAIMSNQRISIVSKSSVMKATCKHPLNR